MLNESNNNGLNLSQCDFGTLAHGNSRGENAQLFTLSNAQGVRVKISNYGGIIVSLETLDNQGIANDIVLGYDDVAGYENDRYYFGAIIGRFAGRINQGLLAIDDKTYPLTLNNNNNQLHGGFQALNKQLWQATTNVTAEKVSLILQHTSPDGDNGFPGNVDFKIIYSLDNHNELSLEFFASTDKATAINLTQHSYFNLAGHTSGDIYQHQLHLNAEHFLPVDHNIFPTGEIRQVADTAQDFRQLTALGKNIASDDEQVVIAKGFDNYWLTTPDAIAGKTYAAQAVEPISGRRLTLYSDQPCLVLYSANYLDGSQRGKNDYHYQKHGAFCFEPQRLANATAGADINHTILRPEQPFYSVTRFIFDNISA